MSFIIASHAIWAIGATEAECLAEYVRDTGDDSLALETISRNPRSGQIYIMPASDALIAQVNREGGDISFNDLGDVADISE